MYRTWIRSYIYSIYYRNSNVPLCFWADWVVRMVVKISANLLRYLTSGTGFLYYFHGQNKYKTTASVHCWFCTKKLINIKVGKLSFLSLKCPFWGQNGLNICNQLQMPEYMVSVYSTWDIYLCLDQTKNKVQIFSIASVR